MISRAPARRVSLALATVTSVALVFVALTSVTAAHAEEGPAIGATVQSTLGLSLSEPSTFTRTAAHDRTSIYTSSIAVAVTATEEPTRLSITDGEALTGRRHGHLVRGSSTLSPALRAAAGHGAYRSLDARLDPALQQWNEPVANAKATIRLRQTIHGAHPHTLRGYHKLLLVTVTAAGP